MDEVAEIRTAVQMLKHGDRATARKKLTQVLKENPQSEMAWLWMSAVVTEPEKRQQCLERTLKINPYNEKARRALERLNEKDSEVVLPKSVPTSVYTDIESTNIASHPSESAVVPAIPESAYVLDIPGFEEHTLTVRSAGLFSGYKLYIDNILAPKSGGVYILKNSAGEGIEIKLKSGIDPLPRVEANGETYQLASKFKSHEWAICSIPLILVAIGGALGGAIGATGMYVNARVLRSNLPAFLKYIAALVVSGATFVLYFVLAMAFHLLMDSLF